MSEPTPHMKQSNRLMRAFIRCATIAPGGTRWPHYELPNDHKCYAVVGFEGENVIGGGPDPAQAREALAWELRRRLFPENNGHV